MTDTPSRPASDATRPRLDGACLSDRVLDAVVAGDTPAAEHRGHLDACPRCRERLALFEAAGAQAAPEIERMLRIARARARSVEPDPPRRASWLSWRGLALAGAALVALALAWPLLRPPPPASAPSDELPGETLRIKGVSMRFFVQRGEEVVPGDPDQRFRTGDALRFVVSSDAPRHILLVGVEASGHVSAYHPFGGDRSVPLEPGIDVALPGSLVLDDSTSPEAFVGLFTDEPLEIDRVRGAVADALATHPELDPALESLDLPGQHRWIVIRRESP